MKQLFRWSGLLGFCAAIVIIGAFWLLLADTLVKNGIEYAGTEALGAEVDLDGADVGIAPLQLRLTHLQVTDPAQPMRNMVEFQNAVASLDLWKLMLGQIVINEMSVDGLKFDTPRTRPGAVRSKAESVEQKPAEKALPGAETKLPSVAEILNKEPLLTTQRSEEMQSAYAEAQEKLKALKADMPDEKQRQQYQQRIQQLTQTKPKTIEEFNRQKQELDKLKKEIGGVKQNLTDAKEQVQQSRQTLQQKLSQLKAAPGEDWQRLSSKYNLSQGGALNLSGLLFGDKLKNWSEKALRWYGMAKPYLGRSGGAEEDEARPERAAGRYIRFPHPNPTPDFLIREARLQFALPFGEVLGQLKDLTTEPQILGRPATLKIDADKLNGAQRLLVDGTFDHIKPQQAHDALQFKLTGLKLDKLQLVQQESMPLQLAQAVSDLNGNFSLQGAAIKADIKGNFKQARFISEANKGLAGEIAKALASVDAFTLNGDISGSLASPKISFSSDLDKRVSQQLQQRIRAKQGEFEQKLRAELNARIAGPQQASTGELQQLDKLDGDLQGQIDAYEKMLQAKVSAVQDKAKDAVEDKAKDKLQKGLEGLKF